MLTLYTPLVSIMNTAFHWLGSVLKATIWTLENVQIVVIPSRIKFNGVKHIDYWDHLG